jgi:hypothetical protein
MMLAPHGECQVLVEKAKSATLREDRGEENRVAFARYCA